MVRETTFLKQTYPDEKIKQVSSTLSSLPVLRPNQCDSKSGFSDYSKTFLILFKILESGKARVTITFTQITNLFPMA